MDTIMDGMVIFRNSVYAHYCEQGGLLQGSGTSVSEAREFLLLQAFIASVFFMKGRDVGNVHQNHSMGVPLLFPVDILFVIIFGHSILRSSLHTCNGKNESKALVSLSYVVLLSSVLPRTSRMTLFTRRPNDQTPTSLVSILFEECLTPFSRPE